MSYGDSGGAVGYLIGEENQGIACMFTMMNNARLAVGVQGVALAERAYQQARAYAFERTQGRLLEGGDGAAKIVQHPDVRRRSEEHTSELQSLMRISYAVFCLKKKNIQTMNQANIK